MSKNRIRLSESQLKNVIAKSVKKMLKEGYDDCDPEDGNCNAPYSEWESFLGGRQPIFEFEDGLTYVDYDENSGCLVSGGVTNNGFHGDGEVEVPVEDGNFQGALEAVYEQLCGMHEPLDESKRRKPAGKKNRVRLSESQLKNVIAKSVKKIISEGGHLTWKDDDGRMHTNSQDNWYGIEGATYVSHGEWSDGEIYFEYQGKQYVINAYDAESWLWSDFKEYCQENNLNPDEHTDDEVWDKFASSEGYEVLLNLGPYNESYEMNENKRRKPAGKKNRVRLSESQLKKVITEGVKQVLSELDWKTYMNAAKKSYEDGPKFQTYDTVDGSHERNDRSRRFAKAAEDALNRDFGYEKEYKSGNKGELRFSTPHNLRDSDYDDRMGREIPQKAHSVASKTYADGGRLSDVGPDHYDDHGYVHYKDPESSWGYRLGDSLPKSDIYKGDKNFKDAINKGEQELNDYHNGNYDYEPNGRGWHLKDNMDESIRRAIKKVLSKQ